MSEIKEPLLYTDTNWEDLLDYDNKIWINIDRYKQLQKENETLKRYQCKRNCASRLAENRKLTDTEILDRYQEWLKEKLNILNEALEDTELDEEIRDCALDRKTMLDKCFYKLIRLKDEVNNDKEI